MKIPAFLFVVEADKFIVRFWTHVFVILKFRLRAAVISHKNKEQFKI